MNLSDDDFGVILKAFCLNNPKQDISKEVIDLILIIDGDTTEENNAVSNLLQELNLTLDFEKVIKNIVPIVSKNN